MNRRALIGVGFLVLVVVALLALRFFRPTTPPPPTIADASVEDPNDYGDGRIQYLGVKHRPAEVDAGVVPPAIPDAGTALSYVVITESFVTTRTDSGPQLSGEEANRVLRAVLPLIQQCVDDLHGRYRDEFHFDYAFSISETQGSDAKLGRAEVSKMTVADPYLRACLEDAPLDTHVESRETGEALVRSPLQFR